MDEEARLWGTFVTLATVGVLLTMGRKHGRLVRYTRDPAQSLYSEEEEEGLFVFSGYYRGTQGARC